MGKWVSVGQVYSTETNETVISVYYGFHGFRGFPMFKVMTIGMVFEITKIPDKIGIIRTFVIINRIRMFVCLSVIVFLSHGNRYIDILYMDRR